MSPTSACPRCQTLVSYAPGERPVCPTCGYPGADRRVRQTPEQTPPAWQDTAAREHRHPPAEAWAERETSGKAIAALVLGISSYVLLGFIGAILAIVLGVMARKEIDRSDGMLEGRAMATWGLWLGIVNIIIGLFVLLVLLAAGITSFERGAGNGAFIL